MKVLILSCNTGGGHNSSSLAIKELFDKSDIECDIIDAVSLWSSKVSKLSSKGHAIMYRRVPSIFNRAYKMGEAHPAKKSERSIMYKLSERGRKNLYRLICSKKYDVIINVHVFSALMTTALCKKYKVNIDTYFVATDYTCSPGVSYCKMNRYFIPHESLKTEFAGKGLPENSLIPTGIPVQTSFYKDVNKEKAKSALGFPANKKMALLACGSMGCGPIKKLAVRLKSELSEDSFAVVICGFNKKLYKHLEDEIVPGRLYVMGFTDKMPELMDAANVFVTKPGGLSSTEAAHKHLPMVLIDAVQGCETHNLNFFVDNDLAVTGNSVSELSDLVNYYLNNTDKALEISERLKSFFPANSAQQIYNSICYEH